MNVEDNNYLPRLTEAAVGVARKAGARILEVYDRGFDVDTKKDGSPVTTADHLAHSLIVEELGRLQPTMPVLSEESTGDAIKDRRTWPSYWLIDPLDGTKEFISRRGEFTVNIALIHQQQPVIGVVYTPVQDLLHWGFQGGDAHRQVGDAQVECIQVKKFRHGIPTIVASRSHGRGNLDKFLQSVERSYGGYELTSMGSALKICIVAEGKADVYPRLGPTSEWDTAAAHCVLLVAGGTLTDCDGNPLLYNKQSLLNPWFIASGRGDEDWSRHLIDLPRDNPS